MKKLLSILSLFVSFAAMAANVTDTNVITKLLYLGDPLGAYGFPCYGVSKYSAAGSYDKAIIYGNPTGLTIFADDQKIDLYCTGGMLLYGSDVDITLNLDVGLTNTSLVSKSTTNIGGYFFGDGHGLTNLSSAGTIYTNSDTRIGLITVFGPTNSIGTNLDNLTLNNVTISGSGSGLTNLSDTTLDNNAWKFSQASKLTDNNNWKRYGWTNTMAKIASGKNFKLLLEGSGEVDVGLFSSTATNLYTHFPVAGCFTLFSGVLDIIANSQDGAPKQDTNWHRGYYRFTTSSHYTHWGHNTKAWNYLTLDYIEHPDGGLFRVYTNANNNVGGGYTGIEINSQNATRAGKTFYWTNSSLVGPFAAGSMTISNITGTNLIIGGGIVNTNIKGGILLGINSSSSSAISKLLAVDSVVRTPIYSEWKPDLILFNSAQSPYASMGTNLSQLFSFYTNTSPAVDVVLAAWPMETLNYFSYYTNSLYLRSNAVLYGRSYFDAYLPFQNTNVMVARGLCYQPGSGHLTTTGMNIYGYWLYRWLDLGYQDIDVSGISLTDATNASLGLLSRTNTWTGDDTFSSPANIFYGNGANLTGLPLQTSLTNSPLGGITTSNLTANGTITASNITATGTFNVGTVNATNWTVGGATPYTGFLTNSTGAVTNLLTVTNGLIMTVTVITP